MLAAYLGLLMLIALQRPVLQDYSEWLWQARLWSASAGPTLRFSLNYGFLFPYWLCAWISPGLAALLGYLLWGLAGAWLFRRRGGNGGLATFVVFLSFPSFYWTGNIAFLNACLLGFLFISISEKPGRSKSSFLVALAAALFHGAVGLALLIYTASRLGLSFARPARKDERRFIWPMLGLLGLFAASALARGQNPVPLRTEWGDLLERVRTLSWAFSPLTLPDALLLSPWKLVYAVAMTLLLGAALVHVLRQTGNWRSLHPGSWAALVVLAAGLLCPLLAFEVVRLDQRLLFCGYAFGLYGLADRTTGQAMDFRMAWLCFAAVALGVLVNLDYDRALRRTVESADAFLSGKTVLGAYMEPYEGGRLSSPLPNYTAHKFFFNYPLVAPMPQYVFHTLFDHVPRAQPDGNLMNRLSRPIDAYGQTVCVVYRDQ